MLAAIAVLPLLAASASALAFDKRAGPLTSPGAAGFVQPPIRGWSSAFQNDGPCGGYNLNGRSDFPISGGDVSIALQRDVYDMKVGYSLSSNPNSNDDFVNLFSNVTVQYIGSYCNQAPDFRTLGAQVGDVASFQMRAANAASSSAAAATAATAKGDSSSSSSASSSSSSEDGVTPLQAGWIGAYVTLAVVALALIGARVAGFKFGRKPAAASTAYAVNVSADGTDSASMTSHGSLRKD
ncbi:hypothetical protein JCM11251_007218 [Rhodosporidiobolus azoricus]